MLTCYDCKNKFCCDKYPPSLVRSWYRTKICNEFEPMEADSDA